MVYICSKQSKIDKLWGRFIKHIIEFQNNGIKVEYERKGEVILDGKRFEPMYTENMERYTPKGWKYPTETPQSIYLYSFSDTVRRIKHLQEVGKW